MEQTKDRDIVLSKLVRIKDVGIRLADYEWVKTSRKVSVIWLLPRKTTRIKWFTIMLRKNKIETILFETKGLTSIGSASRESTPTSWLCKKIVG